MCIAMFGMTSCGPEQVGARITTAYYTVQPYQWVTNANIDYYYSTWENADITPDVIDNGVVLVYYIDADKRDNILPYLLPYETPDGNLYMENIRYDIETGAISFIIQDSDFGTDQTMRSITENGTVFQFKVSVIRN